jgi:hypothetical protein
LFINYKNSKSYMLCRKLHLFATPTLSACSSASDAKGASPYGRLQPKKSSNRYPKLFLKSTLPVCLPVLGFTRRATQRESALAGNCNLREARTWRSVGIHLFSFLFSLLVFLSQSSCHLQIKTPNSSNGYLVVKSDRVMSYQVVAARGLWRRRRRWRWS